MINEVKTITDRKIFEKMLNRFYIDNTVFIKLENRNIEVKLISCLGGLVVIKLPIVTDVPDNSFIFTRCGDNIIYSYLRLCERRSRDIFVFNPVMFQIVIAARKEVRSMMNISGEKKWLIFATNIVSDFVLKRSLILESKKIDRIREIIEYNKGKEYKYMKIHFCSEGKNNDARMNYFYNERTPIFISDLNNEQMISQHNFYMRNIYAKDSCLMGRRELISEVSVPILYNANIPYGYIQVNDTAPFNRSSLHSVKRIVNLIEELSVEFNIFHVSEERLLVSDVSKGGLGIVFRDKKLIPQYKEDSYVSLDMLLPKSKKASILAGVRHIDMLANKIIKIGFEIKSMDDISTSNYAKFLSLIDKSATPSLERRGERSV
ncbi:MAG: hypothetical protein SVZ03_13295 [Spirochaetota bacterium]|nr:hypothetical protein [Spirochaetota bacterium]